MKLFSLLTLFIVTPSFAISSECRLQPDCGVYTPLHTREGQGGGSSPLLPPQGTSVETIVPQGWQSTYAEGDLNKDGIADLVLVATPNFPENQKKRDDGYVYDFNQPILAIYWGLADGTFRLYKQYPEILPVNEDEFGSIDFSLNITNKGVLQLYVEGFFSVGSCNTPKHTYVYRYQNDDFYLIGEETREFSRTTGEDVSVSTNYLTHKTLKTISNGFDDSVRPRSAWSNLPHTPLRRLGEDETGF